MKPPVVLAVLVFAGLTCAAASAQTPAGKSTKPAPSITTPSPSALPTVEGFTADEVEAYLGPPSDKQLRKNDVMIWTYPTPNGAQNVFFKKGVASMFAASRPAGVAARAAVVGACAEGDPLLRELSVRVTGAPAFSEAHMRPDSLTTFRAGTVLPVVHRAGAWYQVQFDDRRWGTRVGYVHCSLLQPVAGAAQ